MRHAGVLGPLAPLVLLLNFRLALVSSMVAVAGRSSCPVIGPFADEATCEVCQTDRDCVRATGTFAATCFKGTSFLKSSQVKSYRCNLTAPQELQSRVQPGVFVQCNTAGSSGSGQQQASGPGPAPAASCTLGLVVSGDPVLCTASVCSIPTNSSTATCQQVQCQCVSTEGCKDGRTADLASSLQGELSWGCLEGPASQPNASACTLGLQGLPGGTAQAVCDVGDCQRPRQLGVAAPEAAYSANILLAFKDTFDNGDELLTDWVATPNSKPCLWDGVSCDSYGRVVTIKLVGRGLEGAIPSPSGWPLPPSLLSLMLGENKIRGTIPESMQLPRGLMELYLQRNQISGTLPLLKYPRNLVGLDYSLNQITGTFAAWPLPSTLTFFTVARNRLVGSLPSDWSPPRALTRLNFDNNQLTGDAMPTSMSLPNMEWYDASDNLFSGPLNANFTLSTSLKLLHLGGNQITGSIPALWALPPGLQRLNLSYNLLTGTLPNVSSRERTLAIVAPGNPGLCGEVPPSPHYARVVDPLTFSSSPLESLPACSNASEGSSPSQGPPNDAAGSSASNTTGGSSSTGESNTAGIIIGGVVGGCALIGAVVAAVGWRRGWLSPPQRQRQQQRQSSAQQASQQASEAAQSNTPQGIGSGSNDREGDGSASLLARFLASLRTEQSLALGASPLPESHSPIRDASPTSSMERAGEHSVWLSSMEHTGEHSVELSGMAHTGEQSVELSGLEHSGEESVRLS